MLFTMIDLEHGVSFNAHDDGGGGVESYVDVHVDVDVGVDVDVEGNVDV